MSDKKKYHPLGVTEDGGHVYEECGGEGRIVEARPHQKGAPLHPGRGYAHIQAQPDGHAEIDIHVDPDGTVNDGDAPAGTGPVKVATDAYRDGWDRIWGSGDGSVN